VLAGREIVRVGPPWGIVGTNDFDGDGNTDILWHNAENGQVQIWFMVGYVRSRTENVALPADLGFVVEPKWKVAALGDFDGDGQADLLWQNKVTGELVIAYLRGSTVVGHAAVGSRDESPALVLDRWRVAGTGDFNRDGVSDILRSNPKTGETDIWYAAGSAISRRVAVDTREGR
jgi:hypothetical protein